MVEEKKNVNDYNIESINASSFCGSVDKDIDKYTKEELYKRAFFEEVTDYYNWSWMREHLSHFEKYGIEKFAFVHFDIKDFKIINEIYGHEVADNMLRKVCRNMAKCEWAYFSCRCDNDNFAMMIHYDAEEVIRQQLDDLFQSMCILDEDDSYVVSFRCGVAYISDVENYRVVITDMAKYAQKRGVIANETEIHFYTDQMKEEQIKGKLIKNDLGRALQDKELLVYYQPKFNPENNRIIGAEALIRWNYKHSELWAPGRFVPYLENEGAIETIDYFVFEEVCRQQEKWKQAGKEIVPISVNISKVCLRNQNFLNNLLDIISKYDVKTENIELEITETLAYDDPQYMLSVMKKVRACGFLLSLDDFGTGFSSLSMLSMMPITTLKIDKSFVDEIENAEDEKIKLIVKDIISMTKHLQIKSIAEGVEIETQKELIRGWGCDAIQGYYYSKPVPVEEFERMMNI